MPYSLESFTDSVRPIAPPVLFINSIMHLTSKILLAVFTFCCVALHSRAQSAVEAPDSIAPVTISTDMPVDQLSLILKPLTKEELAEEAIAWRDRLKQKATEIASIEITVRRLHKGDEATKEAEDSGEKKAEMMGRVNRRREEQAVLLSQFKAVLDAYGVKGGDVTEYRQYAAALGGITVDATDAVGTWMAATGWLSSKEGEAWHSANLGVFPARKSTLAATPSVEWLGPVFVGLQQAYDAAEKGKMWRIRHPRSDAAQQILADEHSRFMAGQISAAEALQVAADKIAKVLD